MSGAYEYGRAIFLIAKEEGRLDDYLSELNVVSSVLSENKEYVGLLDTPAISKKEKLSLIDTAFASLGDNVVSLLKLLCERHLIYSFSEVIKTYTSLYNEEMGIEEVTVITAIPLTSDRAERLKQRLSEITGKKIIISNTVDKGILGGIKIRYSGRQIDASLKTRLDEFEKKLSETVIR